MSNPNRLKVYYPYRCRFCGRLLYRGSSAKRCNLPCITFGDKPATQQCGGRIYRVPGGKARTRPPRLAGRKR